MKEVGFSGDNKVRVKFDEDTPEEMRGYMIIPQAFGTDIEPSDIIFHPGCEIRYVLPGAKVLTRCEKTGGLAYRKVIKVFERNFEGDDLYWLGLQGKFGHTIGIEVTGSHPIWVIGKGWIEARLIVPDDELLSADSRPVRVLSLKQEDWGEYAVYNLEVEDFHSYFVSAESIWVHGWGEYKPA